MNRWGRHFNRRSLDGHAWPVTLKISADPNQALAIELPRLESTVSLGGLFESATIARMSVMS